MRQKDLARVEALVHPEIDFVGPAVTVTGVRELLAALRRIGAIHVRNDIKRVFSDGNAVCVIYDFVTDTIGAVPTIEWLHFENKRIRSASRCRRGRRGSTIAASSNASCAPRFTARWSQGFRVVETRANGQHALAFYLRDHEVYRPHSIQLVRFAEAKVADVVTFIGAAYFRGFDVPALL